MLLMTRMRGSLAVFAVAAMAGACTTTSTAPAGTPAAQNQTQSRSEAPAQKGASLPMPTDAEGLAKIAIDPGAVPHLNAPPDGKWYLDPVTGADVFIIKVEKHPNTYIVLSETQVRLRNGMPLLLAGQDEKFFYAKMFRPPDDSGPQTLTVRAPMTRAEKDVVAATYKTTTARVNRLRFVKTGSGLPQSGQWRQGFRIVDFNGDGKLDLVHSVPRKMIAQPVIFLGDGKGGFSRATNLRFPAGLPYDYGDIEVADLNGDGRMDLVLAIHLRGALALVQTSDGVFENWSEGLEIHIPRGGASLTAFTSRAVTVHDFTRDGRPDIVILGEGRVGPASNPSIGRLLYENLGDGKWKRRGPVGGDDVSGDFITKADVNNDGVMDVVSGSTARDNKKLAMFFSADGSWQVGELPYLRGYAVVTGIAPIDLEGDGDDDLLLSYSSYEGEVWRMGVDLLVHGPGGTWSRKGILVDEDRGAYYSVAAGDIDGDGNADAVALTDKGGVVVMLGDGKGGLSVETAPELLGTDAGCRGYRAEIVDLDGDGKGEIVAAFAGETCNDEGRIVAWRAEKGN